MGHELTPNPATATREQLLVFLDRVMRDTVALGRRVIELEAGPIPGFPPVVSFRWRLNRAGKYPLRPAHL